MSNWVPSYSTKKLKGGKILFSRIAPFDETSIFDEYHNGVYNPREQFLLVKRKKKLVTWAENILIEEVPNVLYRVDLAHNLKPRILKD